MIRTLRALLTLATIAAQIRFDFRGPYWTWRMQTALGAEKRPPRELRRAALEFGDWARRMRTLR